MNRNTRKVFPLADKKRALNLLQSGREAAGIVCINTKPFGPEYRKALDVSKAIDELAEALTGERPTSGSVRSRTAG